MSGPLDSPNGIHYDSDRERYTVEYDRVRDTPSIQLIVAIAEIEGRNIDQIDSLYETIEPDALDAVFRESSTAAVERNDHLSFVYNGREVTVWADGRIDIGLTETERQRLSSGNDASEDDIGECDETREEGEESGERDESTEE
ncbi:HalOD1 output domain-containing protein [Haloprofundus salinisoli]|uniref:HalOD1 output domain-containing protein n=1 Tax=Haloprofundus salinisoli TaxID=2876193 RepID=UPI001CC97656|nr:HalOD1 output domain-containing protein [Haloprofundus salinisoli]